jgi:thermostable 8-oxoguanine DNA glycosylase
MRFLVDPHNITDYERSVSELKLVLLFWVAAAGKKATTAARSLSLLLEEGSTRFRSDDPFEIVSSYGDSLAEAMKRHGMGCHGAKSKCMLALARSGLDLKTCSVSDLESVVGIGPKTARCFVMHSRRGVRHAGLDTHVLKYMRDIGLDVPKSTPSGRKYAEVEEIFLRLADSSGMSVAEFDLDIWRRYSSRAKAK